MGKQGETKAVEVKAIEVKSVELKSEEALDRFMIRKYPLIQDKKEAATHDDVYIADALNELFQQDKASIHEYQNLYGSVSA